MGDSKDSRRQLVAVSQLLLRHRHEVLAFLYSLLHDYHGVEDVFQEVSLTVLQKADEFQIGTNFPAWAITIARHKVREHVRTCRGVVIDEKLLDLMGQAFADIAVDHDLERRKGALRNCLGRLQEKARRFLALRYQEGLSPGAIAEETQQSRTAINSVLQRIREKLKACVESRLLQQDNG